MPPPSAYLGELDEAAVAAAAPEVRVPGRLQVVDTDPLTLLDGAHNPMGSALWPSRMTSWRGGADALIAVVSILEDKDAAAMLRG